MSTAKQYKKIGIISGGSSSEADVSRETAKAIEAAVSELGYPYVVLEADSNIAVSIASNEIDIAFLALHGSYGEDGCIQGMLEMLQIPYTGSGVAASANAFDKVLTRTLLTESRLPVARGWVFDRGQNERAMETTCDQIPVVIKPARSGSSVGISIVKNKAEIQEALDRAWGECSRILIESFFAGREFTVPVYDEKAVGVMEIVPEGQSSFYDYKAKYAVGGSAHIFPAKISEACAQNLCQMAEQAHRAIGCYSYSRVDFIVDDNDSAIILEINTLPGLTPTSLFPEVLQKSGTSFCAMIKHMILRATNHVDE